MKSSEDVQALQKILRLSPEHIALYLYAKQLETGIMPEGKPPPPYDTLNIPEDTLNTFIEHVELGLATRQSWIKLVGSTESEVFWRLPNGDVFRESYDKEGNFLRFEHIVNVY